MKKGQLLRRVIMHLLGISLFLSFELPVVLAGSPRISKVIVFYAFNIAYFYFCRYVVWPFIHRKLQEPAWLIVIPIVLITYLGLTTIITLVANSVLHQPFDVTPTMVRFIIYRGGQIMGIGLLIFYQSLSIKKMNEARKLEQAYQRALLSPHLLFNTLNFVYYAISGEHPKQGKAIKDLSELMRYTLRQSNIMYKATLADEINQMQRYIDLNRLLKDDHCYIEFKANISANAGEITLPSLLFVSLLENMFKHGDFSNPDRAARVEITGDNKVIHCKFYNAKNTKSMYTGESFGLENTRLRLTQNYKHFKLHAENASTYFLLLLDLIL